jgi:cytochrome bd ubiquinol oxidase subunit II
MRELGQRRRAYAANRCADPPATRSSGELIGEHSARALIGAAVTGAIGLGGLVVLRVDAPLLFHGLTGTAHGEAVR